MMVGSTQPFSERKSGAPTGAYDAVAAAFGGGPPLTKQRLMRWKLMRAHPQPPLMAGGLRKLAKKRSGH